jgi:O-antigen ligase
MRERLIPAAAKPAALALALSLGAGAALPFLSVADAVLLIVVLLGALLFVVGRTALLSRPRRAVATRTRASEVPERPDPVAPEPAEAGFRLARRVYYLGLVFLCLLTVRLNGQVTVSDFLFAISLVLVSVEIVVLRRRVPVRLSALVLVGMTLFAFGGMLSSFGAVSPSKSALVVARLIFLGVVWFWLATVVLSRREYLRKAILFWVVSAAVCGGSAILQLLAGNVIPGGSIAGHRATGFTSQPNDLGGLSSTAFVPALMLAVRPRLSAGRRLGACAMLLLILAGLILSGSLGALLASIAAFFVWFALQRSSRQSLSVFAAIALCAVGVITVQVLRGAPTPVQRLSIVTHTASSSPGSTATGSVSARVAVYRVAEKRILQDPFVGVGLDIASITRPFGIADYNFDVHNIVIGLWYETGFFGLLGMVLAFVGIFAYGWQAISQSQSESDRMTAIALVSAFVAFLAFAMSEPALYSRYGWIAPALLTALRAMQRRERALVRARLFREARPLVVAPATS